MRNEKRTGSLAVLSTPSIYDTRLPRDPDDDYFVDRAFTERVFWRNDDDDASGEARSNLASLVGSLFPPGLQGDVTRAPGPLVFSRLLPLHGNTLDRGGIVRACQPGYPANNGCDGNSR